MESVISCASYPARKTIKPEITNAGPLLSVRVGITDETDGGQNKLINMQENDGEQTTGRKTNKHYPCTLQTINNRKEINSTSTSSFETSMLDGLYRPSPDHLLITSFLLITNEKQSCHQVLSWFSKSIQAG